MSEDILLALTHAVQYRRTDGSSIWHTMAAFDSREAAARYAVECSKGDVPWEYQVVELPE